MKKVFLSFLLIVATAITGCSAEPSDDPDAKFVKGENGDWIFNFTADEFVDKWINDPKHEGTNFEIGSNESETWMIDEYDIRIILFKDSKTSKVSGFCIAADYEITVPQHLGMLLDTMNILKYLDEDLYSNELVHKQISEAQNAVSTHKKNKVSFVISDYIYSVYSEGNKAIAVLIIPSPDKQQP